MSPGRYLFLCGSVMLNISVFSATSKGSLGQISTFLLLELAHLVLHFCIEIQEPIGSRTWHFTIRTMSFIKDDSTCFLTPFLDSGIDQTHATPNLALPEQLPNKGSTKTTICSQQSFFYLKEMLYLTPLISFTSLYVSPFSLDHLFTSTSYLLHSLPLCLSISFILHFRLVSRATCEGRRSTF
jgi:hypothetical protein